MTTSSPRAPLRNKNRRKPGGGFGKMLFFLLLLVASGFVCLMFRFNETPQRTWQRIAEYVLWRIQPAPTTIPVPTPAPTPETASIPAATPENVQQSTPVPTASPAVSVTEIPPAPRPDAMAFLIEHPEALPKELTLRVPASFDIISNGASHGVVNAQPGTRLLVRGIEPGFVSVALGEATKRLPIEATDLSARAPDAMQIYQNRAAMKSKLVELRNGQGSAPNGVDAPLLGGPVGDLSNLPTTGDFIHPGGLHTKADLERMKDKVAAHEHPWVDGWELLIKDHLAQSTYRGGADSAILDDGGESGRGRLSRDAHAAYLNFIRWYVSGERQYADCAIRICNGWSAVIDHQPPSGLSGIAIGELAMVGELLRCCPLWKVEDQERFKNMMRAYFYPAVKGYLENHNKTGDSIAWANWDICNMAAVISIGVLLDDRKIFNEGIEYFTHGRGTGSIKNAVYFIHPNGLGQWQESGRDQGHAQLGVGMMAQLCQVAWNQGVDLFSYDVNRLLAGAEYVGASALLEEVPFKYYNNDANAKNYWVSINGYGRMTSPVWELIYNHYVVRRGLKAPRVCAMAKLTRPETGGGDHFGYGTLTFTLKEMTSRYPGMEPPAAPEGLSAHSGMGRVYLDWKPSSLHDASGYLIRRSPANAGEYLTIAEMKKNIANRFTDETAEPGVAYRYVVAAVNPAGIGPDSRPVTAKAEEPGPLPASWKASFIGSEADYPTQQIQATYSEAGSHSIRIKGVGKDISDTEDGATFVGREVKGDCQLVGRLVVSPQVSFASNHAPKMGLMIRESLDPGARCASVGLGEVGLRGTRARFRTEPNGKPSMEQGNDYSWMPVWYKIERKGHTFTAAHSIDGKNWIEVGSCTIRMRSKCMVGFFVTGSENSKTGSVEVMFDNTSLEQSTPQTSS